MPDSKLETLRPRPREILPLLPLGALIGALLGAALGAFNGWLTFMGSGPVLRIGLARVSLAALMQRSVGELEATLRMNMIKHAIALGWRTGLVISLVLVIGIMLISKLRCPFRMALGVQLRVVRAAALFWLAGGINAVIVAAIAPDWFDKIINPESGIMARLRLRSVATVTPSLLRESWMWGSDWGFRIGLVLATIGCLVSFAAKWRQVEKKSRVEALS